MLITPTQEAVERAVRMQPGDTLQVKGDLNVDVIAVEIPDGSGGWTPLVVDTGNGSFTVELHKDNLQYEFTTANYVNINKPATTNEVGVDRIRAFKF